MSNSAYDIFLDHCIDEHYEDNEDFDDEIPWPDEPDVITSDDFDNYDGWDDMQ